MTRRPQASRVIDPDFLLLAYCSGFFPMADPRSGEIGWYSPDPRAIFELEEFHVPRSLRLTMKKGRFEIRVNTRFEQVMRECARRDETWISEDLIRSYVELHRLGFAHSVESWAGGSLVGGLYGVAIGGAFFGESMFSRQKDASKIALVHLVERMKARGFELLDTQWITPHLQMFGAKEIPREEYLQRLQKAIKKTCSFV
jgi:leucyl/phenylalanyl-tRNA--protein transferase